MLSISQFSTLTGKNNKTIAKRIVKLKPEKGENGNGKYYDSKYALPLIFKPDYITELPEGNDELLDVQQERALLARSQRIGQDLKNAKEEGRLVEFEVIKPELEKQFAFIRTMFLNLGSKLCLQLSKMDSPEDIQETIELSVNEALENLSSDVKHG
jgi:phage terminase Nu1 subunit (DNA packaging protein)